MTDEQELRKYGSRGEGFDAAGVCRITIHLDSPPMFFDQ